MIADYIIIDELVKFDETYGIKSRATHEVGIYTDNSVKKVILKPTILDRLEQSRNDKQRKYDKLK